MKVDDIRESVQRMLSATPEAEVLGYVVLLLVDTLESVMEILESVKAAAAVARKYDLGTSPFQPDSPRNNPELENQ